MPSSEVSVTTSPGSRAHQLGETRSDRSVGTSTSSQTSRVRSAPTTKTCPLVLWSPTPGSYPVAGPESAGIPVARSGAAAAGAARTACAPERPRGFRAGRDLPQVHRADEQRHGEAGHRQGGDHGGDVPGPLPGPREARADEEPSDQEGPDQ